MLNLRDATPSDAESIVMMAGLLCLHEGKPLPPFHVEDFLRDGFGDQRAFSTLIAERNDKTVGYVIHYWGYDVDTASRGIHIADLFVMPDERRQGIGRELLKAVARICVAGGGKWVQWFCQKANVTALAFYRSVEAALEDDAVSFCLSGDRLSQMNAFPGEPGLCEIPLAKTAY